MPGFGTKRTNVAVSLLCPLSGTGLLFVIAVTAFLALMRFITWLFTKGEPGLSGASVVIFAVLGASYLARYLTASVEASAEGYDVAPAPPDPLEVESLFGSLLGLVVLLFFSLLPLGVAASLGLAVFPVGHLLLGFAALYFPMGLLGVTVRGDPTGCFPLRVLAAIACSFPRYVAALALSGGAGLLLYLGRDGTLAHLPLLLLVAVDAGAGWLLVALTHRLGVMHRESFVLRSLIPFPEPDVVRSESVVPPRPMTEIERILAERERE